MQIVDVWLYNMGDIAYIILLCAKVLGNLHTCLFHIFSVLLNIGGDR